MSGIGNALIGGLGGLGQGVANLASRYLDEESARNRAQALADIQHAQMVRGEEYMQSEPVQERRRGNERSLLDMRRDVDLQSKVAEATNPELRQARIDDENAFVEGTAGTKLDAERMRAKVMTPLEIEREQALSDVRVNGQLRVLNATQAASSVGSKFKEIESFIGRQLSDDEKLVLVGIQKKGGEDGLNKMAMEAATKALEAQQIKPEEVGAFANRVMQGFQAVRVGAQVAAGIESARRDGKIAEAVGELQRAGLGMEQIKPYLSDAEFKKLSSAGPAAEEPSVGGFIMDVARRAGRALSPDLNAHASGLIAVPDKRRIEELLAMDNDNPAKPLTPENRKKLLQLIGR